VRLYWPYVRVALRRAVAVLAFLGAVLAGVNAGRALLHHSQPPACVITSFAPGPHGSTIYTYSPAGCQPVNSP
jgi:hypothetical protein